MLLQQFLNFAGITAFAASGALIGVRKNLDLWGVATVAVASGVGGGIIRDLLIGIHPPDSIQRWPNITTALVTALVVMVIHPRFRLIQPLVMLFDAVGMGFFATSGAGIALDHHDSAFAAVIIGLITAVGGGIVRDVLVRDIPLLLQPSDLYAVPATLGAMVFVWLDAIGPRWVALLVGSIVATVLRLLALWRGWSLPMASRMRWSGSGLSRTVLGRYGDRSGD
ncbi:TRIC cation channel family protein [Gordonia jinhuaensis]|uniref:Membrane protein n=1 Tax=Gordonia jinhuaensis TaxID=1517702 RepID=A0A916T520_9ACTN|nr:trimeric intracellular cation channel family protein [Gordonia jinhuaensis]GGB29970.1 membrane protein [Gordonia jinhuaensis]